ncbi:hypothetical protein [Glycomyces sp. NPDC048151]|uniref:hypothetical protein n=1 Tax=Glycomyces sp. NPDC048151 TaxID=3364002 RepID=UPI003719445C
MHCHVNGAAPDVWRLDSHAGEAALFAGCLAAASLLALAAAPAAGRPGGPDRRRTTRLSALVSVSAFLGTDAAERLVSGDHPVPPLMVLLIGLAVYTVVGTGTSLLWRYCLGSMRGVSGLLERRFPLAPQRLSMLTERPDAAPARSYTGIRAGRSPPATA